MNPEELENLKRCQERQRRQQPAAAFPRSLSEILEILIDDILHQTERNPGHAENQNQQSQSTD